MRAGRRDRFITIERATTVADTIGHPTETWERLRDEFAELVPIRGAEALRFDREVGSSMIKLVLPYSSDLLVTDRISYDGKKWDIIYISEIGRREGLELMAEVLE